MSCLPTRIKAISGFCILVFAGIITVNAQTAIQWTGTSNTTFSADSNWSGGVAPANDLTTNTALFNGTVTANQPSITASRSIAGLDFQTATGGWTLGTSASGNILTIGSSGINSSNTSGVNTINSALRLGANQTWTVGTGGTFRFGGASFNENGYSANVSGAGTFDIRSVAGATFSGQISTTNLTFNSNANFTISNSANSYTSLAIYSGRNKFASIGNFGQASAAGTGGTSSTISIGASGGNAIFEYTGTTASSNRSFTRDARSTGSGIEVTTSGVTLTLTGAMSNTGAASADSSWNFGGAGNLVVNGAISNHAFKNGIIKTGAGSLTLGGNNTFTGNISIGAGTVEIGASGRLAAGSYAGDISNSGLFIYSGTNAQTLSGIISGAGGVTKNAASTLTLSGANTYTGTTTVNAGTIALGANQSLGAIAGAGNISLSSYNLTANSSSDTTFLGVMSGTGAFTKNGMGILTLSGANSYNGTTTINAGTLQLGGGGTAGTLSTSSAISIGTGGVFSIDRTNTVTQGTDFSGSAIAGTGGFLQNGSGTTVLNATNTYNGSTTINAGTLQIDGNIANSGLVINSGGTISPGSSAAADSFGTSSITINGGGYNWTLNSANGSAGSGWDQITSTGAFTSSGLLTIYAFGTPGDWDNAASYEWDIISASSVTGFSSGNFAIDFSNFGIAGGNRTGTWSFTNPSGGIIRLSYTASGDPVWTGGSGDWSTGFSSTPTNGDTIAFSGVGGTATNNISNGTLTTVNDIEFRNEAGAYTLNANAGSAGASGGMALTVNGSIINNSVNTQTINAELSFADTRVVHANTGDITIGGVISGAGGLTKNRAYTLTLSGNNTYTGATTITEGTLQIGAGGTSGALSTSSAITNNGTLVFNRSNVLVQGTDFSGSALGGTGALIQQGSGTLIFSANNTYTGTTTINAGTLQLGNNGTSGALSISSAISNNGTLAFFRSNNASQGTDFSSSAISGTGSLVQKGSAVLTLNVANTYSGGTVLESGTIAIGHASALGNGTLTINGGRIGSIISNPNVTNAVVVGGDFSLNGLGQAIQLSGAMDLGGATRTITVDGNTANLRGVISNGGLVKSGAANMFLYANNTYTGGTTITSGTLFLQSNGALHSSGSLSLSGGRFDITNMTAASTAIGSLSGTGGTVNLGNKALVVGGDNSDTTFAGTIISTGSANAFTKNGTGSLTLSGSSSYNGTTTLNAGTLVIGHANALGTSAVVQSNGSSVLKIDTTGMITNAMSVYNVLASQSATASGAITVNNATIEVEAGDTLTISGEVSGSGGVTKTGDGTLVLSGSNSYSSATTVNAGTLEAASASALSSNNATVQVNGGSLLVTADDAINGKAITLNSTSTTVAGLAFSGTYNGTAGLLTLSQDSIIDLGEGSVVLHFTDLVMGLDNTLYTLAIYNWTGTTLWGGGNGDNTDQFYIDRSLSSSELNRISFYSGGLGTNSFVGTGYQLSGGSFNNEVIPVPEPETYATGVLLLIGCGWLYVRKMRRDRIREV
jgi:fibronectin-binding autotransporter adhesin